VRGSDPPGERPPLIGQDIADILIEGTAIPIRKERAEPHSLADTGRGRHFGGPWGRGNRDNAAIAQAPQPASPFE
jgi:hypothetical protein